MTTNHRKASSLLSMFSRSLRVLWLLIPLAGLLLPAAHAQQLTATLSGTATDQTGARIPGASILIKNDATGDKRDTKADREGFFSVTALVPGTYTVTITSKGFSTWKETGVLLNQGDSRTIPNIHLKISSDENSVTVIAGQDAEVPVDTAEISATLNNDLIDSATLTGRNAAEVIKMMPGVTYNNAGGAGSGYNSQTTGTNNGPAGNFSANGAQPYGSTAVILDGANLLDPGNAGTQVANINQDMTDSVKFLSASYGAEYAKGPAILQAFSKSGGQKFHGEGYFYARNGGFGYANDWFNKSQQESLASNQAGATQDGISAANKVNPQHFYYVGGNVGGPLSFKGFNKNKDKLFFWVGYENMIQTPYNAPVEMNVPTGGVAGQPLGQRDGDFNNLGVDSHVISTYANAYATPCSYTWGGCGQNTPWAPSGGFTPGQVPNLKAYFDKTGSIFGNLNPLENQTPTQSNGWNNYGYSPSTPANRWETTGKVSYNFNDNNKLWGSYTYQTETDDHPLSIWWAPEWAIPYPSEPVGKETAHVYLANYTHVFNATTTNEFVFSYAEFVNDNSLTNTSATSRAALGFPAQSMFGSSHLTDQIPNLNGGWSTGATEIQEMSFAGGLYGPNSFGKTSKSPAITDTFTKIVKTHSLKAGFYWDTQENLQSSSSEGPPGDYNGTYNTNPWGSSSTSNLIADMYMARVGSYTEASSSPNEDMAQHEWSIWAQDSWKVTPKLTLNLGLRADHEGQWYDKIGDIQVWDGPTADTIGTTTGGSYSNASNAAANTGLLWNKLSSKIPTSGWISPLFFYNPRLGAAYDVFGNGKTVVRGGFGTYRYQVSGGDASNAAGGPLGLYEFSTSGQANGGNGFYGYGGLANQGFVVPKGLNQNGSTIYADVQGDNKVPYANTYSFGVAQAGPSHTVFQASYVGSVSRNQLENGANGHISDANAVPYGAFFAKDPVTGVLMNPQPCALANCATPPAGATAPAALTANDYRPLANYTDVWLETHGGFANYNSLQVAAQKQSGNLFLFTNFTFGKVLGTRDGSTSNGNGNGPVVDPFNFAANYGPLEYDHTKSFNLSFNYKLPKPIHNNFLLGQAINGWEISSYSNYQDGAPFQTTAPSLNATYNQILDSKGNPTQTFQLPNGLYTQAIGASEWYGTNRYENSLQPVLTCDPRKNLHLKGQVFNANCFAAPLPPTATSYGQHGQTIWPYIRTPHYWGSDMAVFKAFKVTDSQRFELRISATNWLNHPTAQFGLAGNSDQQLTFNGVSTSSGLVYNSNSSTTGVALNKVGYRWMQFAGKYYF